MTAEERRALRVLIDRAQRENGYDDEAERDRPKGWSRKAKLTEDDVQRCYLMYQATSSRYVAQLVWKHYGYASVHACQMALLRAFKRRGLTLHPVGDPRGRHRAALAIEQAKREAA